MYKSFDAFFEEKENNNFTEQIDEFCNAIAMSEKPFEEYWQNYAIPVLIEQGYSNEEELLQEFWKGLKKGLKNWWNNDPSQMQQVQRNSAQLPVGGLMHHQEPQGLPQKTNPYQDTADKSVVKIKNEFAKQMRDFLNAIQSDAKQNNDYISWKIARKFYDKLMKTAQPVIDKFAIKANYTKDQNVRAANRQDRANFQKGVEGIRQQRMQQRMNRKDDILAKNSMPGPQDHIPGDLPGQTMKRAAMSPQ